MTARNPFAPRDVKSRRGGPVKAPLTRDAIVEAAMAILLRDGLDGMTLRKVAAAVETGAASLYAYVEDQQELHALVLDRALGAVQTSGLRGKGWRQHLTALLESYLHALMRGPGLARLALSTVPAGPHALRIMDASLALLAEGGIEPGTAAWTVDLLLLYATGIAAEQSHRGAMDGHRGRIAAAIATVSPAEYPHVHALGAQLLSGSGQDRFAWAIDAILEGALRTQRRSSSGAPAGATWAAPGSRGARRLQADRE